MPRPLIGGIAAVVNVRGCDAVATASAPSTTTSDAIATAGIEATICRLKDFRRVATHYDKLARNFHATVTPASLVAFWT